MICNAFRTATITPVELSAMRADAAKCNARLASVLKAAAIGDNPESQLDRVKREFAIILEMAQGEPFTARDAQAWVDRKEETVKVRLTAMIGKGLLVQEGVRNRAKLYRPVSS